MENKPYEYSFPVTGAGFVGRSAILNSICLELSYPKGASYAIIGGRRFGKSSLLLSVNEKVSCDHKFNDIFCVSIDLNQHFSSPENFFAYALKEISNLAFKRFQNPNHIRHFSGITGDSISYQNFVEIIQSITENMSPKTRIGLLLDEMDALLTDDWHEILFDQLRTLAYSSTVKNKISLVLAGTHYYYETKKRGSPLMNILRPIHLECMQEAAIQELIKLGGKMSREVEKEVWDYSGGHPHLAQYILNNLWEESSGFDNVKAEFVHKVVKQYYREHDQNLKNWVTSPEPDICRVYDVLSKEKGWMDEEDVARKAKLSMSRTNLALINLCFQGIVYTNPDTGVDYRAQGDLFRNWFIQNRKELLLNQEVVNKSSDTKQSPMYKIKHIEIVQNKVVANKIDGTVSQKTGLTAPEVKKIFKSIYGQIKNRPETSDSEKKAITVAVKEIEQSLAKKTPEPKFLQARFQNLQKMAPDILEVILATVTSPASGFATVAKKIAEKVKKNT